MVLSCLWKPGHHHDWAPGSHRAGEPGQSIPEWFACLVCRFTLKAHEIQAAGIPRSIPLVDGEGERLMSKAEEFLWHVDPAGQGEEVPD